MATTVQQVRGDHRSAELAEKNRRNVQPRFKRTVDWALQNQIYLFNISPYPQKVELGSAGTYTVHACEPGHLYSKPTVIPGAVPYGVPVEMQEVDIREEDGRAIAIDIIGLGIGRNAKDALLRWGVFIAANDTFDPKNPQDWVDNGELSDTPSEKELKAARALFVAADKERITEADTYHRGGTGDRDITALHRDACDRLGQNREWNKPLESLVECPGCGEKVRPGIIKHVACGFIFDTEKAIAGGMMARPESKADLEAVPSPKTKRT